MEAFQERMVNEYKELSDRVDKLEKFIKKNTLFDKLDKQERIYQVWQLAAMTSYRTALSNRLIYQGIKISDDSIPDA